MCRSVLPRLADAALLTAAAIALIAFAGWLGLRPREPMTDGLAVVFPPWQDEAQVTQQALAAGARLLRPAGASFIAVVMPDDAGYTQRVRQAGAWLVLDPKALGICLRPATASL